ncbi:MAG: DUF1272 domain-containing protein [Candidatus Eremiobacteraeota bacterium]|nr:DUF1272 domain-containing protein [Candidatus Eremiobacteraeota bacterium]
MKSSCERCGRLLHDASDAWACSYECTFCSNCAQAMNRQCPNCGGALTVVSHGSSTR